MSTPMRRTHQNNTPVRVEDRNGGTADGQSATRTVRNLRALRNAAAPSSPTRPTADSRTSAAVSLTGSDSVAVAARAHPGPAVEATSLHTSVQGAPHDGDRTEPSAVGVRTLVYCDIEHGGTLTYLGADRHPPRQRVRHSALTHDVRTWVLIADETASEIEAERLAVAAAQDLVEAGTALRVPMGVVRGLLRALEREQSAHARTISQDIG